MQDLRGASQEELGDDDYDLLLYASGRNNRVLLSDVLQNSPAAAAGIEPGDLLVRYDDRAVFNTRDLLSAPMALPHGEVLLVDAAGHGDSPDALAAMGQQRAALVYLASMFASFG